MDTLPFLIIVLIFYGHVKLFIETGQNLDKMGHPGLTIAGQGMYMDKKLTIRNFKFEEKYTTINDTVLLPSGTSGVPFYQDGKLIKYLENA